MDLCLMLKNEIGVKPLNERLLRKKEKQKKPNDTGRKNV